MSLSDKILVVGAGLSDASISRIKAQLETDFEIVVSESTNLPKDCAVIMPKDMIDKIDEIDFSSVPTYSSAPKVVMEFRLPEIPEMTDMSGYFKEQERQQRMQHKETMRNISRYHSNLSKKGFKR